MTDRREYFRHYITAKNHEWRAKVLAHLGGKCVRCGFTDPRALQIDHVRGDGWQEPRVGTQRRKGGGGAPYYRRVVADTTGRYQLLCANCNWIKRVENKEHS
jgi:hypothetical protein